MANYLVMSLFRHFSLCLNTVKALLNYMFVIVTVVYSHCFVLFQGTTESSVRPNDRNPAGKYIKKRHHS